MLPHFFQDTQLATGAEFDTYVDGQRKSFTVKEIFPCSDMTLQVEAEDSDGNIETFFDIPLVFIS